MSRVAALLCALAGHLLPLAAQAASVPAGAAGTHPFAAPDVAAGAPVPAARGLLEVTLALLVVLGAIFALAWLARRVRGIGPAAGALGVLAEVRLGPKERAVLIRVGATQLLLGVAPGQVNTLHVLTEPLSTAAPATVQANTPNFRTLLLRSLGKS